MQPDHSILYCDAMEEGLLVIKEVGVREPELVCHTVVQSQIEFELTVGQTLVTPALLEIHSDGVVLRRKTSTWIKPQRNLQRWVWLWSWDILLLLLFCKNQILIPFFSYALWALFGNILTAFVHCEWVRSRILMNPEWRHQSDVGHIAFFRSSAGVPECSQVTARTKQHVPSGGATPSINSWPSQKKKKRNKSAASFDSVEDV